MLDPNLNVKLHEEIYGAITKIITECYPRIKGAHCASIAYGIIGFISAREAKAAPAQATQEIIGWYSDCMIDVNEDSQNGPAKYIPFRKIIASPRVPPIGNWKPLVDAAPAQAEAPKYGGAEQGEKAIENRISPVGKGYHGGAEPSAAPAMGDKLQPHQEDAEYKLFCAAHRAAISKTVPNASQEMTQWHADRHWNGKPGEMWRARACMALRQPSAALPEGEIGALEYRGNTVSHIYDRAKAYGDELMKRPSATAPVSQPAAQELTVWYGPMPESNGKSNFTAVLMRKAEMWDGPHVTIERSEYPDRIRYEADRVRYLIGELATEPFILDYDAEKHSGYTAPQPLSAPAGSEQKGGAA